MHVLIACEFSGITREWFRRLGHDAWSCDLLPTEIPGNHLERDVRLILSDDWDLMIAYPPCTHLCTSGARWFAQKETEQEEALQFVADLMNAPIARIALENPIGVISTRIRKPDQIIQPWQFGHGEVKRTCLWLSGLPKLTATQIVAGRVARVHHVTRDTPDRWKVRSRTYPGIAKAMALQWSVFRD